MLGLLRAPLDRATGTTKDGMVQCPIRSTRVPVGRCLDCGLLVSASPSERPDTIVCEAYAISSWIASLADME